MGIDVVVVWRLERNCFRHRFLTKFRIVLHVPLLLVGFTHGVREIERQLRMSQPTVSKHLRVLREAGFVESTVDAQRRLYRLKPEPFEELDAWLARFRRFWSDHVDALERHLDRMEQSSPTKNKTGKIRRGSNREHDKGGKK